MVLKLERLVLLRRHPENRAAARVLAQPMVAAMNVAGETRETLNETSGIHAFDVHLAALQTLPRPWTLSSVSHPTASAGIHLAPTRLCVELTGLAHI